MFQSFPPEVENANMSCVNATSRKQCIILHFDGRSTPNDERYDIFNTILRTSQWGVGYAVLLGRVELMLDAAYSIDLSARDSELPPSSSPVDVRRLDVFFFWIVLFAVQYQSSPTLYCYIQLLRRRHVCVSFCTGLVASSKPE